ncbi:DUF3649 domain-containing protein [Tardiphaga sp. 813_E8_N1_3]|uniref:DUF3649 domain-containing protein n=1 Tax=Tardiphaga sp. 813_E8_N1_3 TaxID=3240760 RepID=UPI003F22A613
MRLIWLPTTARIFAGFVGGYALSAVVALFLAKALPAVRLETVLAGAMIGFVVNVVAIIWAFAARTATRACLGIFVPCVALGAISHIVR